LPVGPDVLVDAKVLVTVGIKRTPVDAATPVTTETPTASGGE